MPSLLGEADLMKGVRQKTKDSFVLTVYDKRYGTCQIYHDKQGKRLIELRYAIGVRGKILDEIEQRTFDPDHYKPKKAVKLAFDVAIMDWLNDADLAPSTRSDYRNKIQTVLIPHFKDTHIADIVGKEIKAFYKGLKKTTKTKNNIMSVLRSFFKQLKEDEVIREMPGFPAWKKPGYRYRKTCSWKVLEDILSAIDNPMVVDAIITMRLELLRTGEVRALRWEDILFDENQIIIRNSFSDNTFRETTKNDGWVCKHLHSKVKEMLLPRKGLSNGWVFHNNGKPFHESLMRKVFDKARDEKEYSKELTMYGATRHSSATEAYADTKDIRGLQKALGHRDIRTTQRYEHYDSTQEIIERKKGKVIKLKDKKGEDE